MRVLVLNGTADETSLAEELARRAEKLFHADGWSSDTIVLRDADVAPCTGCFGCWVRTPGICLIDDAGRRIARMAMAADFLLFVTPIVFGGYSSVLKKGLDRLIPVISPFFEKIDGEVHHRSRYSRYPHLVAIGTLPAPDPEAEGAFATLLARNAINLRSPGHAAGVIHSGISSAAAEDVIRELIQKAGVTP